MGLCQQSAEQGPQLPLFGMPLESPAPEPLPGVDLLALAPIVAGEARQRGAATIVMGDWRELQLLQRALQPWRDCLITKPGPWAQKRCTEWASQPDGVMFCTPSVLAVYWRTLLAVDTEIQVLALMVTPEATTALDLLGQAKPLLTVVRREFTMTSWTPVAIRDPNTIDVVYPLSDG